MRIDLLLFESRAKWCVLAWIVQNTWLLVLVLVLVFFFFFKAIYSVNCNTDGGDNSNNFLTKFECMFAKSARFHKLDK